MKTKRLDGLTDLHMVVISWLKLHPGHTPEDIAKRLRADVDEIARLCANLSAAGFIEPTTSRSCRGGHGAVLW